MRARDFGDSNAVLQAPQGMKNCDPLPIRRENGEMASCWELDDEDLAKINESRCIFLWIVGQGHPPVRLAVADSVGFKSDTPDCRAPVRLSDGSSWGVAYCGKTRGHDGVCGVSD